MKKTKLLILFLVLVLTITVIPINYTNAASKKSKAYKAYKELLEEGFAISYTDSAYEVKAYGFTLVDVTGDGLKELVVDIEKGKKICYNIFTYNSKDGAVSIYDGLVAMEAYYLNKSKHSICSVGKWDNKLEYAIHNYNKNNNQFELNPKEIKSVPKGYTKLVTKYSNTSANRKKLLG